MSSLTSLLDGTDYGEITSYASDFDNAEMFGATAIMDTYNEVFEEAKNDYRYLTELVMVLNYKSWKWFYKKDRTISKLYYDLFEEVSLYASCTLADDELEYYFDRPHISL